MKFIEAKNRLKKMADGAYHSIQYELIEDANGNLEARCSVYIDGYEYSPAPTWEQALYGMKAQIDKRKKITPNPSEAPRDEL